MSFFLLGRFSKAQRQLYLALLEIQVSLIDMCTVGYSLTDIYREMLSKMATMVIELSLVPKCVAADEPKLKKVETVTTSIFTIGKTLLLLSYL